MIHPDTELRFIDQNVGYGVFATAFIPEGTITYVKDSLELVITPTDYLLYTDEMKTVIDKYSYIDEKGHKIVSWDFAKYVNHCCNCNTISTGYGFEVAIRDILVGEQITDEYGVFNLESGMDVYCGSSRCRSRIDTMDFETNYQDWDKKIKKSFSRLFVVDQPLIPLIDEKTRKELDTFFINPKNYKSVYALKYHHNNGIARVKNKKTNQG